MYLTCPRCKRAFSSRHALGVHISRAHPTESRAELLDQATSTVGDDDEPEDEDDEELDEDQAADTVEAQPTTVCVDLSAHDVDVLTVAALVQHHDDLTALLVDLVNDTVTVLQTQPAIRHVLDALTTARNQ